MLKALSGWVPGREERHRGPGSHVRAPVGSSHSQRLKAQVIQDLKCMGLVGEQAFRTC